MLTNNFLLMIGSNRQNIFWDNAHSRDYEEGQKDLWVDQAKWFRKPRYRKARRPREFCKSWRIEPRTAASDGKHSTPNPPPALSTTSFILCCNRSIFYLNQYAASYASTFFSITCWLLTITSFALRGFASTFRLFENDLHIGRGSFAGGSRQWRWVKRSPIQT